MNVWLDHRRARKLEERWRPNPSQVVLFAFVAFIVVGTGWLSLPFAHTDVHHDWVDDLFVAASAVCVTGLTPVDLGTHYSLAGQLIILMLIQIGGLGYMTLFTVSMLLVGRQLSMRDRITLQEATDQPGMTGLVNFIKKIVGFTLVLEGLGFCLLAFHTVPEFGWGRGLYLALFHAVAAFNNAGFSLFPEGAIHWQTQGSALVVLSLLVIAGGLGFNVNHELVDRYLLRKKPNRRWDVMITLVLTLTAVLVVGGTLMFWAFEHNNLRTLAPLAWYDQLANSFFMAVQPRSSGFHSVDAGMLERSTLLMTMCLMFIGGGPGGTAGGIKLTTFAIIVATILASARGQDDVTLFNFRRVVGEKQIRKAFTVMALSIAGVVVVASLLTSLEPHPFLPLLFEATSAFSTVGLSMGITGHLTDTSKLVLVATMLVGRVGVLVILLSLITHRRRTSVHYMEEPLLIG